MAIPSRRQFIQPPDAPVLSEQQWPAVDEGSGSAVFHDGRQTPIATFAGLRAELAWREETEVASRGGAWGSWHFEMPAGTVMTVLHQPPLPVTGVTLQFPKETRQLRPTGEESACADLATDRLMG